MTNTFNMLWGNCHIRLSYICSLDDKVCYKHLIRVDVHKDGRARIEEDKIYYPIIIHKTCRLRRVFMFYLFSLVQTI